MTTAKHTPGPWRAECFLVTAENGREITHVGLLGRRRSSHDGQSGGQECEANARLIAAAPDLLAYAEMSEALGEYHRDGSGFTSEMVLAVMTKHGYVPRNPEFPCMGGGEWAREFRAKAIAKARGEAP